jgi:hypothetical protein
MVVFELNWGTIQNLVPSCIELIMHNVKGVVFIIHVIE